MERAQKTRDDPSSAGAGILRLRCPFDRQVSSTPVRLNRLFSLATPGNFPDRSGSQISAASFRPLPRHLYTRGLLDGRHSDIQVTAFGQTYKLHRLILDQAKFFASALQEPWLEASAKEITLYPAEIDHNITKSSFELALKRLYGCKESSEENAEAVGLFATGCWLEMPDLVQESILAIIRSLSVDNVASIIQLVTANYYGLHGERILASARSLINRDGWNMPLKYWESVPSDVVCDIVGGDAFFVPREFDRWVLAKSLLDMKLQRIVAKNNVEETKVNNLQYTPRCAPRTGKHLAKAPAIFRAIYSDPNVLPLLQLLDNRVHYMHLSFEELQLIRTSKDVYGTPVVPDKVVTDALWQGLQLRQTVLTAKFDDPSLHLSQVVEDANILDFSSEDVQHAEIYATQQTSYKDEDENQVEQEDAPTNQDSLESDDVDEPKRYWIPPADNNRVFGFINDCNSKQRSSALEQPEESLPLHSLKQRQIAEQRGPRPVSYTYFPPHRFSVELPNPKYMKEKKKLHSPDIWIAGSLWNIYCQRIEGTTGTRLGFYLYRAKLSEASVVSFCTNTVEGRIGALERDMITPEERTERIRWKRRHQHQSRTASGNDPVETNIVPRLTPTSSVPFHRFTAATLTHDDRPAISTQHAVPRQRSDTNLSDSSDGEYRSVLHNTNTGVVSPSSRRSRSTGENVLPPYTDARPVIKAYFKIYLSSNAGRTTSLYESAPDTFKRSQSWGWESAAMMADEQEIFRHFDVDGGNDDRGNDDENDDDDDYDDDYDDLPNLVSADISGLNASEPWSPLPRTRSPEILVDSRRMTGEGKTRTDTTLKFVVVLGVV